MAELKQKEIREQLRNMNDDDMTHLQVDDATRDAVALGETVLRVCIALLALQVCAVHLRKHVNLC